MKESAARLEQCRGCGALLPPSDGPTHAYMTSSPACWEAFGQVLAREYSTPELMDIHRLSVDTWAVQHPGDGSRQAIQSVWLHLARLMLQLEAGLASHSANDAMLALAKHKKDFEPLPPRSHYSMTVADVFEMADVQTHREGVIAWAEATWADWFDQHEVIRNWVRESPALWYARRDG